MPINVCLYLFYLRLLIQLEAGWLTHSLRLVYIYIFFLFIYNNSNNKEEEEEREIRVNSDGRFKLIDLSKSSDY